jgi:hypothetical protein
MKARLKNTNMHSFHLQWWPSTVIKLENEREGCSVCQLHYKAIDNFEEEESKVVILGDRAYSKQASPDTQLTSFGTCLSGTAVMLVTFIGENAGFYPFVYA